MTPASILGRRAVTRIAAIAMAATFVVDINVNMLAVGALYMLCLWILLGQPVQTIKAFAGLACLLSVISIVLEVGDLTSNWKITLANGTISIAVIVVTALLLCRIRRASEVIVEQRSKYIHELEDTVKRISIAAEGPIASCRERISSIRSEREVTKAEVRVVLSQIAPDAKEVDEFTQHLTTFVHRVKQRNEANTQLLGDKTDDSDDDSDDDSTNERVT